MKFISIIGYDRSGTTFFGSYYTLYSNKVFYAGEIDKALQILKSKQLEICSCGQPFTECPVWGQIYDLMKAGKLIDFQDIIFEIQKITGAEVIIDSSKQVDFVKECSNIFKENFYTIHLKRNPKGIVLSRMNNRKLRITQNRHPKPHIAKRYNLMMVYDSIDWMYRNYIFEKIKSKEKNLDLTYDNFDKELPEKIIAFNKKHNIDLGRNSIKNHVLWGDRKRMNFEEKIKINHSWKTELNVFQKITTDFVTFPIRFLKSYKFN